MNMKSRLHFRRYAKYVGELELFQQPDLIDYYYVIGRSVNLYPENDLCADEYRTYASTVVPPDEWKEFIEKLKSRYESVELHDARQAFIFKNEADEAAFIMESSDWIDV